MDLPEGEGGRWHETRQRWQEERPTLPQSDDVRTSLRPAGLGSECTSSALPGRRSCWKTREKRKRISRKKSNCWSDYRTIWTEKLCQCYPSPCLLLLTEKVQQQVVSAQTGETTLLFKSRQKDKRLIAHLDMAMRENQYVMKWKPFRWPKFDSKTIIFHQLSTGKSNRGLFLFGFVFFANLNLKLIC